MDETHLVYVSPVPIILKAFPKHCHDLIAGDHVVGQVRNVGHLRAGRAPRVIGCRLPHLREEPSCGIWLKRKECVSAASHVMITGTLRYDFHLCSYQVGHEISICS